MKRTSLLIAFLCALLVGFGADQALAQNGIVQLDHVNGLVSGTTVANSTPLRFVIRLNNDSGKKCDVAMGWRLTSPDGAVWDSTTMDSCGPFNLDGESILLLRFNQVAAFTRFSTEGQPPDTVGFLGAGSPTSASRQLPIGYNDTAFAVVAWVSNDANAGKHICIDSSWWEPGGVWKWVYNTGIGVEDLFPEWRGLSGEAPTPGQGFCFQFEGGAAPIVLNAAPATLTFNATEGGANPVAQQFNITEQTAQAVAVSLSGYASWIQPTPTSGTTPQAVSVGVNIAGLLPGTYTDTIVVTGVNSTNSPFVVVTLNVTPRPKTLVVAPDTLFFTVQEQGPLPTFQNFAVSEIGAAVIPFTASEATSWITLTNAAGNTPANVRVDVSSSALAPGDYFGTVTFTSAGATNSPLDRTVKLTVTAAPKTLSVVPTVLNFNAIEGGASPAPQSVAVTETGGFPVSFTATENAGWISLTNQDLTTPGGFDVNIDVTGVGEGSYSDTIQVAAAGVTNSPIKVAINLTVSPAEQKLLDLHPDTLYFFSTENGNAPDPEIMTIHQVGGGALSYLASTEAPWIFLSKNAGTTPDSLIVLADIADMTAGVYLDSIRVDANEASNSPQFVYVKLTLEPFLCPTLVISDTFYQVNGEIDQMVMFGDTISLASSGQDMVWWIANPSSAFNIVPLLGTTPQQFAFTYMATKSEPGTYTDCFTVISGISVPEGETQGHLICSTAVSVCVQLTVVGPQCAQLLTSDTLFQFNALEGEPPTPASRTITIYTSDSSNVPVIVSRPMDADWTDLIDEFGDTVSTVSGTTPLTVTMVTRSTGLVPGGYNATCIITSPDESVCTPRAKTFTIHLNVTRDQNSLEDSVIVATSTGTPGGKSTVEVYLANICDVYQGSFQLLYPDQYLDLDSVSFVGSRLPENMFKMIQPDSGSVTISYEALFEGSELPSGSGLMATLYFGISPMTPLGATQHITLGGVNTMTRNCDGAEVVFPSFVGGGIVVDEILTDTICGYVTDEEGMSIEGAVVQLWENWPYGSPIATTTTNENGAFFFGGPHPNPYDVYAFAEGYYPNWKLDNYGTQCGTIKLRKLQDLIPVDRWVDYYCGFATLDDSIALPIGTVVEVKDADGTLAGRQIVTEPGVIRFMPVYRDSAGSAIDEGAETGDMLWFYVNGMIAETSPSEVIYPADYAQVEVCVNGSLRGGKVCQLMEGWNLVSWNVDTPADSITAVLGEIMDCVEVVLGFEGGGLTYDPELEQFSTLWYTDHLSGYWIKVKTGCSPELRLAGSVVPANTPIPVYRGWNLVSYLPEVTLTPLDALNSVNGNLLIAYGYDNGIQVYQPGMGNFNTLEEMMSCHGYWLKVSTDDLLIYPGGDIVPTIAREMPHAAAARMTAATDVNSTIAWVNLYSRDLTVNGRMVKSGSTIEAISPNGTKIGSFRVQRDGQFGFMPVYSDAGLNETVTGLKPGDKFSLRIDGVEVNETITWTTTGDRIELARLTTSAGGTLPGSFSLKQNYPNPFNPSTTISFSLPSKGMARIEIYNVLGKLVAVPFNGSAEAGEHQVVWDGKNETGEAVASGVYFYRLTADNYTDTKKMMLLK